MQVKPGSSLPHDLPAGGVPHDVQAIVHLNVRHFLRSQGEGVTPLVWKPQGQYKLSPTQSHWPQDFSFPDTLHQSPVPGHLRDLFQRVRRLLHFQSPVTPEFSTALDAMFPNRPPAEVAADTSHMH